MGNYIDVQKMMMTMTQIPLLTDKDVCECKSLTLPPTGKKGALDFK